MPVLITTVSEYFIRYGWEYFQVDEAGQAIMTGFTTKNRKYMLSAIVDQGWLCLTLKNFLPLLMADYKEQAYKAALEANSHLAFARFSLISDDELTLVTDIPAESKLDYDLFAMAIDLIVYYADRFFPVLNTAITGQSNSNSAVEASE